MLAGLDRKTATRTKIAEERGWRARPVSTHARAPGRSDRSSSARRHRSHDSRTRCRQDRASCAVGSRGPSGPVAGVLFVPASTGEDARHRVVVDNGPQRGPNAPNAAAGSHLTGATRAGSRETSSRPSTTGAKSREGAPETRAGGAGRRTRRGPSHAARFGREAARIGGGNAAPQRPAGVSRRAVLEERMNGG